MAAIAAGGFHRYFGTGKSLSFVRCTGNETRSSFRMTTFFVSYNRADRQWAEWIAWQLEGAGNKAFIQAWDIRPGSNFVLAMQDVTAKADRTVAVLSPDYVEAKFTQPEWSAAFVQDPTGERGLLVPVRVREVELRGMWVAIVYIDLVGLTEEEAKQALLNGIALGRAKPPVMPTFPGDMTPPTTPARGEPKYPVSGPGPRDPFVNWSVLDAAATDDGGLAFLFRPESTRVTELNAVELSADQRELIDRLSNQATNSFMSGDFQVALFELLIPNRLKEPLTRSTHLRLLVDEQTARYPWELLAEPSQTPGTPNFALRSGLIRSLSMRYLRPRPVEGTSSLSALVIGDPMLHTYPGLPGAEFESVKVSNVLRSQWKKVRTLTGATALGILGALFAEPYKIVHIAARASNVRGHPGLLIGDDIRLTPAEFGQMSVLPDLVFINCGHVGPLGPYPPDEPHGGSLGPFAAAYAVGLISIGVRALIVSGAVVEDASCITFTTALYRALLQGETFGASVQNARLLTHETAVSATTWGAFHCYGDPDFRIVESPMKDGCPLPGELPAPNPALKGTRRKRRSP